MTEPQSSGWDARLVRMANDIARNFAALGHDHAATATADHITHFWNQRMKEKLFAIAGQGINPLSPIVEIAVHILQHGAPPPQTKATADIPGSSDAG